MQTKVDKLNVKVLSSRDEMGKAAAADIAATIRALLAEKESINMIFAAAPSQNEVLASLLAEDVDFSRINAFHMDEYIGLDPRFSGAAFANFLKEHIFDKAPFRSVNLIRAEATDADAECERYAALLEKYPTDIVVMGIGENGHIAFNDPPVADFDDKKIVKVVKLDEVCRQQQVNDGCFPAVENVPTHAMTLTCPTLTRASHLFCIVPAKTKAVAVRATLCDPISEQCPATVLRRHDSATLYLEPDSAALL